MFHRKDLDTKEMIRFDELRAQSELGQRVNAMKLEGYWYKIHCNLAPLGCLKKEEVMKYRFSLTLWHCQTSGKQEKLISTSKTRHLPGCPKQPYVFALQTTYKQGILGSCPGEWAIYIWLGHLLWPNGVEEASKAKAWVLSCLHQWGQIVESEFWSGLGNISMLS